MFQRVLGTPSHLGVRRNGGTEDENEPDPIEHLSHLGARRHLDVACDCDTAILAT